MKDLPGVQPGASPPLQTFVTAQMDKYNVIVTDAHQKIYGDISTLKDSQWKTKAKGRESCAYAHTPRLRR